MRKFKVLKCTQTREIRDLRKVKTGDGVYRTVTFTRTIEAGEEGWWPGAYGHEKIKEGDILELDDYFAEKAEKNTEYFQEVFDEPKLESPPKKKVGRPKKAAA